jgi:hypothetical protein
VIAPRRARKVALSQTGAVKRLERYKSQVIHHWAAAMDADSYKKYQSRGFWYAAIS